MANIIKQIKDTITSDAIYPITLTKAVYDEDNNRLDNTLTTKEDKTNKVTSFQSTPDNTHYPSEKLVKDSLDTKYVKPTTGIPKTDLASDVQTSLGKADTAIQDISGKMDKANPTGTGSFSLNRKSETTVGVNSVATGISTTAPELPATTLADGCYYAMFNGCTSLYVSDTSGTEYHNAWTIPTNDVASGDYTMSYMFGSCKGTRSTDSPNFNGVQKTYYTQNVPV